MMPGDHKIFFLDAYALIFRAYYAFIRNPRVNTKGLNTSAIFGFTNTLLEILNNERPTHVAAVFDPQTKTFRHDIYSEYKANRESTPEDIKQAVPYIKKILKAFGIPVIQIDGFEADDIIGTLATKACKAGYTSYMMTSDKDYAQLVRDNLFIYKPRSSGAGVEILGVNEIKEKYGINTPAQFIDILALWGDKVDNVPGVEGVGEKTAIKLINEFESIDNLIANADKLKGKLKERIINGQDNIILSRRLVEIITDLPIELDIENMHVSERDEISIREILEELEFKSILERVFPGNMAKKQEAVQQSLFDQVETNVQSKDDGFPDTNDQFDSIGTVKKEYHLIQSQNERGELIQLLKNQEYFCFDTETTSKDSHEANLIGIAFSFQCHQAFYVPVPSDFEEIKSILQEFSLVFEDESILKIGQNLKYDLCVLAKYDIEVKGKLFDTMVAHYLLHPELSHSLDLMANQYLNYEPISIETLIGSKGKNQLNMRDIEVERVKDYACEDADVTCLVFEKMKEEIVSRGSADLFENIEMPLVLVLSEMERAGVTIDHEALNEYAILLNKEARDVEENIYKMAGEVFNISSPKQLGEILFDKLCIDVKVKMTKTKQYSTSEETLLKIKDKHPIIEQILTCRSLRKLISTYVEALPKLVNSNSGRIHTSFNQTITSTGRLSSNNPNLQNIPIREERGRLIRKAFIPSSPGNLIISADYSQIELRLMAHMSGDKNMIQAFIDGEDIHTATAAKIFNVSLDNVTKEMRAKAKTANFGIIYGISEFGLSQRLGIPRHEAKELITGYFKTYPFINEYKNKQIDFAVKNGYVVTIMGRKRYLNDINSKNGVVRGFAERNAINAPIQGSAADIIKMAMINIYKRINNKFKSKMILQVHDELVFDAYKQEVEEMMQIIKWEMENTISLSVPLIVEIGKGENWLEAH